MEGGTFYIKKKRMFTLFSEEHTNIIDSENKIFRYEFRQ